MPRPPEFYVLDVGMHVPARIAAWLLHSRGGDLDAVRRAGVPDPEAAAVLEAMHRLAERWRAAQRVPPRGTNRAGVSEPVAPSVLTTQQAADRLGLRSTRAITKAIAEKRLLATKVRGRWEINTSDLSHLRSRRRT